jgi:hypothetical protein
MQRCENIHEELSPDKMNRKFELLFVFKEHICLHTEPRYLHIQNKMNVFEFKLENISNSVMVSHYPWK